MPAFFFFLASLSFALGGRSEGVYEGQRGQAVNDKVCNSREWWLWPAFEGAAGGGSTVREGDAPGPCHLRFPLTTPRTIALWCSVRQVSLSGEDPTHVLYCPIHLGSARSGTTFATSTVAGSRPTDLKLARASAFDEAMAARC